MQALFEGAVLGLRCINRDWAESCRCSHVSDAPLATVGPKKRLVVMGSQERHFALQKTASLSAIRPP